MLAETANPHVHAPRSLCGAMDAQPTEAARARLFLLAYDDRPPPLALIRACAAGYGTYVDPDAKPGHPHHRPASHLHEVTLFGFPASAATPEELARAWSKATRSTLDAGGV